VCTSRQEGVPYPVLEAMSCECVVLSTEVGIVPEIFDDGVNGFLLRESHLTRGLY
jgi:glycosyltransferase involved in cell wall biosynthesis